MVAASIKFTQNAVSPGPGIAMVGIGGLPVTIENANDVGVIDWTYELLDTPLDSAIPPSVLSSGPFPTANFTPDSGPETPGCYRVKLTVRAADGSEACDIRNFGVPTNEGWILPPFKATADELNFPGNTEGWESLLNRIFLYQTLLEYADQAARDAATLTANDIGRLARQLDNNTFWVLRNDAPLQWVPVGHNLAPALGTVAETIIYVRSTGDDNTGDGRTTLTAYRTIRRALEDIPYIIYGERYIIDCTGIGQELNTDATLLPPIMSPDATVFDPQPQGFTNKGPLTIQADPTVIDTISPAELVGQISDPTTQLRQIDTTKNYTADQHRGRMLRDVNGLLGVITTNSVGPGSRLGTTQRTAWVAPIDIIEPSAEIRNSDPAGGNAFEMRNSNCQVQLNGIKMTTANPSSFRYGLWLDNYLSRVSMQLCYIDGFFGAIGACQPSFNASTIMKRLAVSGMGLFMFNCFTDQAVIAIRNGGMSTDANFIYYGVFDGCGPFGGGTGIEDVNSVCTSLNYVQIQNGTGDGVFVSSGSLLKVNRLDVSNCNGDAISVQAANRTYLVNVTGAANTGIGIRITDGAQVRVASVSVAGLGGDYKIGGNAISPWGGFTGDENDLGAVTPQICRMHL
jgi:hypothetical protein